MTKQYDSYKPSGVEWLRDIPSHWNVTHLKNLIDYTTGNTPDSTTSLFYGGEGDLPWANISDLGDFNIFSTKKFLTKEGAASKNLKLVNKDSLLFSFKLSVGICSFNKISLYTNEAIAAFEENKNINLKWLKYFMSSLFINNSKENIYGAPILNRGLIENGYILNIKKIEQTAIANFLDKEIPLLDDSIKVLKSQKERIIEYNKAIIHKAVTQGLDDSVPMKDCSQYIIQDGWSLNRVKELFYISRGRVISKENMNETGKYPIYSSQTKNNGVMGYIDSYDFNGNYLTWTTDGVNAGTVFIRTGKFNCTNVCGTLKLKNKNNDLKYLYYVLALIAKENKRDDINGGKIMSNEMAILKIPYPNSIREQQKIANYLNIKTSQKDKAVAEIDKQIGLIEEYKKTLINDVVTGKKRVYEGDV